MTGLAAATSGVSQPQQNPAPIEGSLFPYPFWPPYGLAKLGWLKTLKNSARNWARKRSPKCQFLATEKSKSRKPESGKMLRPMVPKVPSGGGIRMELPLAKQPWKAKDSVAAPGDPPSKARAFALQAALLVGIDGALFPGKNGKPVGPDLKSSGFP